MLSQALLFFGVDVSKFQFLDRMMKGCYNFNPPRVRYSFTWDVNMVLDCLCLLFISIGGFIFKGLNIEVDHFSSIGYCCQGSILVSTSLKIYA